MPMELLQALAHAEMPLVVANLEVQDKLRILHDAGHIICSFSSAGTLPPACVRLVTALGHRALRHFGPGPRRAGSFAVGSRLSKEDQLRHSIAACPHNSVLLVAIP